MSEMKKTPLTFGDTSPSLYITQEHLRVLYNMERERDELQRKLDDLTAKNKRLCSELENLRADKIHPDAACSSCRKTLTENYGQDWLCVDCMKKYHTEFERLRQELKSRAQRKEGQ